jgi:hypothetical protein
VAVDSKPASPSRHAPARRRAPTAARPARAERAEPREKRPSSTARSSFGRDRGVDLMLIFVAATLLMVVAVAVVTVVDRWWVLVPVMLVDFAATFAVLTSITSLLGDESGPAA